MKTLVLQNVEGDLDARFNKLSKRHPLDDVWRVIDLRRRRVQSHRLQLTEDMEMIVCPCVCHLVEFLLAALCDGYFKPSRADNRPVGVMTHINPDP